MKIVYVGDNRNRMNFGCRATSTALSQIISMDHKIVGRVHGNFRNIDTKKIFFMKCLPSRVYNFLSKRKHWDLYKDFFISMIHIFRKLKVRFSPDDFITLDFEKTIENLIKCIPANELLKECDLRQYDFDALVVNGEGSFVFSKIPWREAMMEATLMYWAKKMGKKVYFLNGMFSASPNCDPNFKTLELMKPLFENIDVVCVREEQSNIFAKMYFPAANILKCPDALFSWWDYINDDYKVMNGRYSIGQSGAEDESFYAFDFTKPYICISGSSSSEITKDYSKSIFNIFNNLIEGYNFMNIYTLTKEESQRIDILKVVMCFGVCFVHSYSANIMGSKLISDFTYFISKIICDSAVPTYFLISSVLLYRSTKYTWRQNLKKKLRGLLIPYLIFNTLWILMTMMRLVFLDTPSSSIPNYFRYSLFDWINAYFGLVGECKPELSILWFVRDLFLLNILSFIIKWLIDRFPKAMMIFNLIVWFGCISTYGENTYTLYGLHTYGLVFWVFGYYIVKYDIHMKVLDNISISVGALIFIAIAIADFVIEWPPLHRVFIIVAVIYAVRISECFILRDESNLEGIVSKKGKYKAVINRLIQILTPTTFFIYLTHRFLYTIISFFYENTALIYLIMYLVKPAVAVFFGALGYYILNRICPNLLGTLTGGRITKKL